MTILGAPGAGKGTQAQALALFYNIAHISTGDLLRQFIRGELNKIDSPQQISTKIKSLETDAELLDAQIRRGDLVPDDVIYELLVNRLSQQDCNSGYVLDGFPRNISQAEMFEKNGYRFDAVVAISVDDEVIIDRIIGRWSCPVCGKPYHRLNNPPKSEGKCDECMVSLVRRSDDNEQIVINRLKIYHNVTKPIIEFYREHGILREVSGIGTVGEITEAIANAIELNEA